MGYFEQQDRSKQAAAGPQQPPQAIPVAPPQVPPSFPQQPAAPPAANRASAAVPPPATPANQFQGGGNAGRQPFQRSFIDGDFSFVSRLCLKIICCVFIHLCTCQSDEYVDVRTCVCVCVYSCRDFRLTSCGGEKRCSTKRWKRRSMNCANVTPPNVSRSLMPSPPRNASSRKQTSDTVACSCQACWDCKFVRTRLLSVSHHIIKSSRCSQC